jgi:hypothetical protein
MTEIDKTLDEAKAAALPVNIRFDEIWERLAGESTAAYAAFRVYRDYGPDRNIRRAVEANEKDKEGSGKMGRDGDYGRERKAAGLVTANGGRAEPKQGEINFILEFEGL